ncbi:MAG: DUF4381 domain-containing protein [Gammaproteobacteria bacterium]|nr:DUF4381 domain-containing protein [Gammaproteobacteria bacterium]
MADNQEIIRKLRDIHLPEPTSIFPLQPAWWGVIGFFCLVLLGAGYYFFYFRKRQQRQALKQLASIEYRFEQGEASGVCMMELGLLLKHYAVVQFPQTAIAYRWGEEWLAFLVATSTEGQFEEGRGHAVTQWPYQKEPARDDVPSLFDAAGKWLKENPYRSYRKVRMGRVKA